MRISIEYIQDIQCYAMTSCDRWPAKSIIGAEGYNERSYRSSATRVKRVAIARGESIVRVDSSLTARQPAAQSAKSALAY